MKGSNFLQLKIYRRTFLVYLSIVVIFCTLIISNSYNNAYIAGQQAFEDRMKRAFVQMEGELDGVVATIDNFLTRLYNSSMLKKDFFDFFGAAPAEYVEARLRSSYVIDDTYLDSCDNLVADSGYLIRYILYYSAGNIMCMEYNQSGYSRYRMLEPEEGEELCRNGYVYTRDIYRDSVYAGKISFVVDVGVPVEKIFCAEEGNFAWMEIQGEGRLFGNRGAEIDFQGIAESGSRLGKLSLTAGKAGKYFYTVNLSERYACLVAVAGESDPYVRDQLREMWILFAGLLLVFVLITMLYIRQFSAEGKYLQDILLSMESARDGSFKRVEVGGRSDEFAVIARQLNGLYENLEALIQQKYELTISQQRAQMQMLSAQLNPHFLYNTLERIRLRALRVQNTEIAEATANLGLLYRNIVKTESVITLGREIDITKQYLELMCFLHDGQFIYHCDVDGELLEVPTPKIWMQPIVENFFKHNFGQDDKIKVVVLSGVKRGGEIRFTFFDNVGSIREEQLEFLNGCFTPEESRKGERDVGGVSGCGMCITGSGFTTGTGYR